MDDSRFDAFARALSGRIPRRAMLASFSALLPAGATAKKRKRLRLGKACDGITNRCKHGHCIEGVCACRDHQEPCRGKCVRLGTCCPRRLPQRCGNQCIPKGACCFARGRCPCNGTCIRCGDCCRDSECPGGPNACARGVCRNRKCIKEALVGQPCGTAGAGVCNADGLCEVPGCVKDSDCKLLPEEDSRCASRSCVNGWCIPNHVPHGTVLGNFMAGDCKMDVCDGGGGIGTIADNTDLPAQSPQCPNPRCEDSIPRCY